MIDNIRNLIALAIQEFIAIIHSCPPTTKISGVALSGRNSLQFEIRELGEQLTCLQSEARNSPREGIDRQTPIEYIEGLSSLGITASIPPHPIYVNTFLPA
jgi:hypothetical protein